MRGYLHYADLKRSMIPQERTKTYVKGTMQDTWADIPGDPIKVYVTNATPRDRMIAEGQDYSITHQIVHEGPPLLQAEERWRDPVSGIVYVVRNVTNPGQANLWAVYEVEEHDVEDAG